MADSEAGRICFEIIRIANGRKEVPYSAVASDDVVEQSFDMLLDSLKAARKCGLLSFEGEQLFKGKHDSVPIKLTEKGLALKAEQANSVPVSAKKVFFEGEEALTEVAKPDGVWNWCLVGPDPDKLPLAGGGSGSIEQMAEAMGLLANTFGLLRLDFGSNKYGAPETKWVYIHANMVDEDEEGQFTAVERGKAKAKGPLMQTRIEGLAKISCKMEGTSKADFTAELAIARLLKSGGANTKQINLDNYKRGLALLQKANPQMDELGLQPTALLNPETIDDAMKHIASLKPEAMAAEKPAGAGIEEFPDVPKDGEELTKQRKKMPSYKVGDTIKVKVKALPGNWDWTDDGIILEILAAPMLLADGVSELPTGSVKLQYAKDQRIKWVLPSSLTMDIEKSKRPRPPSNYCGELYKETHGLFTIWHLRYFELQMGSLSWWDSNESAKSKDPRAFFPLLGAFMKVEGTVIKLAAQGCRGIVYCFDAGDSLITDWWTKAFTAHIAYAHDMCLYMEHEKMEAKADAAAEAKQTAEAA